MSNQMCVTGASDIPAAIEFVKKHVAGGKGPGTMVCPLVLFQSIFDLIINNVQKTLDSVPQITQGYDSLMSVHSRKQAKASQDESLHALFVDSIRTYAEAAKLLDHA